MLTAYNGIDFLEYNKTTDEIPEWMYNVSMYMFNYKT